MQAVRERLTPRLSFMCDTYDSYPVLETFEFYKDGQRMGFMDIAAMEDDEFSNPSGKWAQFAEVTAGRKARRVPMV